MCTALDLTDTTMALANIEGEDKRQQSLGLRGRAPWLLNESGLYSLILRSRKPEAREFSRWVTKVVLATIRRDGAYVIGEERQDIDRG